MTSNDNDGAVPGPGEATTNEPSVDNTLPTRERGTADAESSRSVLGRDYSAERVREEENFNRYLSEVEKPDYLEILEDTARAYTAKEHFDPGDIVRWKNLMRIQRYPAADAPAVFLRYLSDREIRLAAGQLFNPLHIDDDCVIGYLDYDLDFETVRCASARLTRFCQPGSL